MWSSLVRSRRKARGEPPRALRPNVTVEEVRASAASALSPTRQVTVAVIWAARLLWPSIENRRACSSDDYVGAVLQVGDTITSMASTGVVTDANIVSERDVDFEIRVRRTEQE